MSLEKEALTYVSTANGRLLRGKRMVAHHVADVSFVLTVQSVLSSGSFDRVSHGVAVRRAIQQSRGGARLRDGNSGRSGASPGHHAE